MLSSLAGPLLLLLLSLSSSVRAAAIPSYDNAVDDHVSQGILPERWYHNDNHHAHALFRRQATTASSFPEVGSPTWAAAYPGGTPDSNAMPQAWKDALNIAVQAGKIPNIAPASQAAPNTPPFYNPPVDPTSAQVCSAAHGCRNHGDIYDAPPGVIGIAFDDGPLPPSDNLYAFLHQNEIPATHFYIGTNILMNWKEFNIAFQTNQDDIAIHTWTHPYMTALSNADVVAQLGWSLQLIYNSTGGRLARYWRPPYGDTDARVSAIAEEVFGLTAILWNHDQDWTLGSPGGITPQAIQANFQNWLSNPQKTPGLVVLEHELSDAGVQCFMAAYPLIKQFNWVIKSVVDLAGLGPYQNVDDDTSQPTLVPLTAGGNGGGGLIASTSSSSSPPPPTPTSSTNASKATSAPDTNAKKNGATPGMSSSPIMLLVSTLALAFSLCLI